MLAGEAIRYDPNGKIKEKIFYKAGKPYGDIIKYDENGHVKQATPPLETTPKPSIWQKWGAFLKREG